MWTQFAREHVQLGEIDAPYIFAANCLRVKGEGWTQRMLLYYFLYYDLEGAVACADSDMTFWGYAFKVFPTAKRGKSRRHFRGANGQVALDKLCSLGDTNQIFKALYRPNYTALVENVRVNFRGCQIGDYFQWKLMDIFDRCLGWPVSLSMDAALRHLPDTPREGARIMFKDLTLEEALLKVVSVIDDLPAPGLPTRFCGLPEAETILCAMAGYLSGAYKVGDDIRSRHEQLRNYPELLRLLPIQQDWSRYTYEI